MNYNIKLFILILILTIYKNNDILNIKWGENLCTFYLHNIEYRKWITNISHNNSDLSRFVQVELRIQCNTMQTFGTLFSGL